jgi:ABC-type branched-subunit amino acid transport system substrate-binding protein
MIEMVEADDQNNPDEGTTALERMVEQDGVVAAGGVISSDVGLATSRTAEELEVPLFLVKAGAGGILSQDSRYTFRTCLPSR